MGSGEVPIVRAMLSNEGINPDKDVDLRQLEMRQVLFYLHLKKMRSRHIVAVHMTSFRYWEEDLKRLHSCQQNLGRCLRHNYH